MENRTTCCIAMNNYTYTYACRNIFNTIKTSRHISLEKYTFHFIERVVCERELETEQNCNILTPTLMAITVFLSCSPGLLNRRPGAQPLLGHVSHSNIFSPTDLNFLSPGLYNNLTSTYSMRASLFRTQFNPINSQGRPWSPDIFDRMHLLFTQVHFFFWQLGRLEVNMQQSQLI